MRNFLWLALNDNSQAHLFEEFTYQNILNDAKKQATCHSTLSLCGAADRMGQLTDVKGAKLNGIWDESFIAVLQVKCPNCQVALTALGVGGQAVAS